QGSGIRGQEAGDRRQDADAGLLSPTSCCAGWTNFWFAATYPGGLHWLRVLCGLLFLFWLAPFAGHQLELFSLTGWFGARAYRELVQPGGAAVPTGWSLVYLCGENAFLLSALWLAALGVFLLFTLGVATRVTAVLPWLCVVSFTAAPATLYHADFLLI